MSNTISAREFEILRTAVTVAKNENIRRLSGLKFRLAQLFPNEETEVSSALQFWANQIHANNNDQKFIQGLIHAPLEEWTNICNGPKAYSDLAPAMLSVAVIREATLHKVIQDLTELLKSK